jgi:hypothetical protein
MNNGDGIETTALMVLLADPERGGSVDVLVYDWRKAEQVGWSYMAREDHVSGHVKSYGFVVRASTTPEGLATRISGRHGAHMGNSFDSGYARMHMPAAEAKILLENLDPRKRNQRELYVGQYRQ